jgi:hypothetical protein
MRLIATTLRAEVTAKQGDAPATRQAIQDGLALWEELRSRPGGPGEMSVEHFESWERWARGWLARTPP